jgi:hypothetical protein
MFAFGEVIKRLQSQSAGVDSDIQERNSLVTDVFILQANHARMDSNVGVGDTSHALAQRTVSCLPFRSSQAQNLIITADLISDFKSNQHPGQC